MHPHHEHTSTTVTIPVTLLDSLMNLAGELVLGRNQLLQAISCDDRRLLDTTSQRINMVTSEIQEQIMRTRMQPMATLFDRLLPLVEEAAQACGKQVDLRVKGKGVELDKTLLTVIDDPLSWLIRQAVNHGIETPDARNASNKPGRGRIEVKAYQEAGQVNIEVTDDGKGINPDTLVRRAVASGLITDNGKDAGITESEKMALVFLPGLLQNAEPTDSAAQYAGLEAIRLALEKVGGSIDLKATHGYGTTVRIKLPLSLSIIPSQIIRLGEERFAIPQTNLSELLRVPAGQAKQVIEKVGGASVIRLRGELLPLVDLAGVLDVPRTFIHPEDGQPRPERRRQIADRRSKDHSIPEADYDGPDRRQDQDRRYHAQSALNIAVVVTGKYKYGLVVDELNDAEEIVVKSLGRHLKVCHGFAGATIMGDGRVALILDVASIGKHAHLESDRIDPASQQIAESHDAEASDNTGRQSYLFFCNSSAERFGVPLDRVERIEKINADDIEMVGGRRVLKYRGGTLPLVALHESISAEPLPEKSHYQVICFNVDGREIGILSTPPIDAAEVSITLDRTTLTQPGVLGSAVLMEKTVRILDVEHITKSI